MSVITNMWDLFQKHGNVIAVMDELKIAGVQRIAVATDTKTR
jgi:biopolymer transport protein ExbD